MIMNAPRLFARLYLDEDVPVQVAEILRGHGYDVRTVRGEGMPVGLHNFIGRNCRFRYAVCTFFLQRTIVPSSDTRGKIATFETRHVHSLNPSE